MPLRHDSDSLFTTQRVSEFALDAIPKEIL